VYCRLEAERGLTRVALAQDMSLFSFLPLDERIQLRLVCKSWARAVSDERNWRAVDFAALGPTQGTSVPPLLAWALRAHGRHMHDISTRGCRVGDEALKLIGRYCPNLEVLIVDEPPSDREDEPASIRALSAPPCITDAGMAALSHCPQLTRLDASRCRLSKEGVASLAGSLAFLSYLKLGGATLTDSHVQVLAPAGKDLLALDISGSPVTEHSLRTIAAHCSRLRMLNCEGCEGVTDMGLMTLVRGCPDLRILLLSGCSRLTDAAVAELATSCRHLHRLDIARLPLITNAGVERIADCCEALESISLLGCPGVTAEGLAMVVSDCVHLRQLAADGVGLHAVVDELSPQGLGLTALTVRRCGGLTDAAAAALATSCPAVTSLDLSGSPLVGLTHLAAGTLVHRLKGLRALVLGGCGLTDQSFAFFPTSRVRLSRLDISHNPGVTDVGLELVLRACGTTLTDLSVAGCDITSAGAALIAVSAGPSLTRLDCRMCLKLTDEGVAFLAEGSPNLETLLLGVDGPTLRAVSTPLSLIHEALPIDSPYAALLALDATPSAAAAAPDTATTSTAAASSMESPVELSKDAVDGSAPGDDAKKRRKRKKKKGTNKGTDDASSVKDETASVAEETGSRSNGGLALSAAAKKRARRRRRAAAKTSKSVAAARAPLGDEAALAIAAHCPRLRNLHMSGWGSLTEDGLRGLLAGAFASRLCELHLGLTAALTEEVAADAIRAFPALRVLAIHGCEGSEDGGALGMSQALELEAVAQARCPDAVVDVLPPRWGPPESIRPASEPVSLIGPVPASETPLEVDSASA
jgi:hypothetical protein